MFCNSLRLSVDHYNLLDKGHVAELVMVLVS